MEKNSPVNLKKVEMELAWLQFYSNSKDLAIPTRENPKEAFRCRKRVEKYQAQVIRS